MKKAIRDETCRGWLFSNYRHRDLLTDSLLAVSNAQSNTRPWYFALHGEGTSVKIVHAIEPNILDHLEGSTFLYSSRQELIQYLTALRGGPWACLISECLPANSGLDGGSLRFLESLGLECVSADALLQRSHSLLDIDGIMSHERAARGLYDIAAAAWAEISAAYHSARPVSEADIIDFIRGAMAAKGLICMDGPMVAAGPNTAFPHYWPQGRGRYFKQGDIIQLDVWAKENNDTAIYADFSWVGYFGCQPNNEMIRRLQTVFAARDRAIAYIQDALRGERPCSGAQVDIEVRKIIQDAGYGEFIKHRTGHGIDREDHGVGVNLDAVEFPDYRIIMEGSCFSIEPGIYGQDFGMRSEVDAYVRDGRLCISGGQPQSSILVVGENHAGL